MTGEELGAAADGSAMSDAEYERRTLEYWIRRIPNLGDVTVIVRKRGASRPSRTIVLDAFTSSAGSSESPPAPSAPSGTAPQE